jgi:predicted nucleic acid-binding protein
MLVIDASIIVSSYFEREKFHKRAKKFFQKIIEAKETILLPEIAFPEIASAIARGTNDPQYALNFCEELRRLPNFVFIPVDESISQFSVEIASKYFLKGADSIYVAVAYKYSAALCTLDEKQKEKASKIVEVINL